MIEDLNEMQIMQLITTIVNRHGCRIVEMDIANRILNIDGPEEARTACAGELEMFLE